MPRPNKSAKMLRYRSWRMCLSCAESIAQENEAAYWTLFWVSNHKSLTTVYGGTRCDWCDQRADDDAAKAVATKVTSYFRGQGPEAISREAEEQAEALKAQEEE